MVGKYRQKKIGSAFYTASVMLKVLLVSPVATPAADAVRVYPFPLLLIERPLKVATPEIALVPGDPPVSTPPGPASVPIASVTSVTMRISHFCARSTSM